jgi:hypothetical protein
MAKEEKERDPASKLAKRKGKKDPEDDGEKKKGGKLRWFFGWIVLPGTLLGSIFLAGVHVGARHPDMVLSRLFVWLFS